MTIDEQGTIQTANPAAEKLLGYAAQELKGQNISLLVPSAYREQHDRYLASYLATGIKKMIGIGRELQARRKDGSVVSIDLSVSEFWLGESRLFSGVMRDISERQRAQEMAHKLAAIIDGSQDAIIGITLDGVVTSWNRGAEKLSGSSAEEMIGTAPFHTIPAYRQAVTLRFPPRWLTALPEIRGLEVSDVQGLKKS